MPLLPRADDYAAIIDGFSHRIPEHFNIGTACCDAWAAADAIRPCLIAPDPVGTGWIRHSFGEMKAESDRFTGWLQAAGLRRGDRVAIHLAQSFATGAAHLGALKAGMVVVPLAPIFGPDALVRRLQETEAKILVTDAAGAAKLAPHRHSLPALAQILCTEPDQPATQGWSAALDQAPPPQTVETLATDPAYICFAAVGSGEPKGAVLAHQVLLGALPGLELAYDFPPQPEDVIWSPAEWSFIAGLFCTVLAGWYWGIPVVAHRSEKFDAAQTFALMAETGVTLAFIPPTAGKMLRASPDAAKGVTLRTRAIVSGGEPFTPELQGWALQTFGCKMNDFYGQTECNAVIVTNSRIMEAKPFKMGRPAPGRIVAVLDPEGNPVAPGGIGRIAVKTPDPVMLTEYWRQPQATADKFRDGWLLTGDLGQLHDDGYISFRLREDDVITSAGYRIGPKEIETCLETHPAIARAAAFGVPDPVRTEVVAAWIVLAPGQEGSEALAAEIRAHVRARLAAHEYPREIRFATELPMLGAEPDRKAIQARHAGASNASKAGGEPA